MQFLVLSRSTLEAGRREDFMPLLAAERDHSGLLYADGFIRWIWSRGDMPGACALVEAETADQVRQTWSSLPLVKAGLVTIESVIALQPRFMPRG